MPLTTFWLSFEDEATEAWVGTVIIDREDFELNEETMHSLMIELDELDLTPGEGRFTVDIQRLLPEANIPASHKNRLITNAAETAEVGGVMRSRRGPH